MEKAKAQRGVFRERLNFRVGVGFGLAMVWILAGCAAVSPGSKSGSGAEAGDGSQSVAGGSGSEPSKSGRKFAEPRELDKLLDAKPIALAAVKPASQGAAASGAPVQAKASETASPGRGKFRIQISAESDVDAAQAKKEVLEKQLGGTVDVVFDAPYYKLRWGYFESKQEAEDKLLELSDQKIQGFVVKQ
jgi:septal ring-binding cell division protein DamX